MKYKTQILLLLSVITFIISPSLSYGQGKSNPLRLGIVGLSHGHLGEVVSRIDRGDFIIVGVAEKNTDLWSINKKLKEKVSIERFYTDLEKMLKESQPEAVIVYTSIYDHLAVVEACAPKGIHVMVEKPLAVSLEHAHKMNDLVKENPIHLLTNYETTWYPSNHTVYEFIHAENKIGNIVRMNIYAGHEGPIEIGCGPEFTEWLTNPKLNGGGAVIDFGCYGANLSTWLMGGERPQSVYAKLKTLKPSVYPAVDDEATIILEYAKVTTLVMGSWNWPMSRKDMHIYGTKGYVYQDDNISLRIGDNSSQSAVESEPLDAPYNDAFLYLKSVVRGDIAVNSNDLSSLDNNLVVMEILDAAIRSSNENRPIDLK